jgi:hypothetical protein
VRRDRGGASLPGSARQRVARREGGSDDRVSSRLAAASGVFYILAIIVGEN